MIEWNYEKELKAIQGIIGSWSKRNITFWEELLYVKLLFYQN